jgi:hypothetical protein
MAPHYRPADPDGTYYDLVDDDDLDPDLDGDFGGVEDDELDVPPLEPPELARQHFVEAADHLIGLLVERYRDFLGEVQPVLKEITGLLRNGPTGGTNVSAVADHERLCRPFVEAVSALRQLSVDHVAEPVQQLGQALTSIETVVAELSVRGYDGHLDVRQLLRRIETAQAAHIPRLREQAERVGRFLGD